MGTTFFVCGGILIALGVAANKTKNEKLINLLIKRKTSDTDASHLRKAIFIPVIMGIISIVMGIVMYIIA